MGGQLDMTNRPGRAGLGGETRDAPRPSPVPGRRPPSFFQTPLAGVRIAATRARCLPTACLLRCAQKMQISLVEWRYRPGPHLPRVLASCPGVHQENRDPVLHLPAASMASSSSTAALCNTPGDSHSATPDPDVAAVGFGRRSMATQPGTEADQPTTNNSLSLVRRPMPRARLVPLRLGCRSRPTGSAIPPPHPVPLP